MTNFTEYYIAEENITAAVIEEDNTFKIEFWTAGNDGTAAKLIGTSRHYNYESHADSYLLEEYPDSLRRCTCGDIMDSGYFAEWSEDWFCSTGCAQEELGAEDVAEGLEDQSFFWTTVG